MRSLLVSHDITAGLSEYRLNGQNFKRGHDANMWPARAKQVTRAKQKGGRASLNPLKI